MPPRLKSRLELLVLAIGGISGLIGLFGAFVLLPQRVDALEKRVHEVATTTQRDHDTLVRIEERLKAVQDKVDRLLQLRPQERTIATTE